MGKEVLICVADSSCERRKAYVWIDRYKMQDQDEECGPCGRVARAAWLHRHHLRAGRADLGEFWATCGPRRQRTAVAGLLRSNVVDARRAEARSCRRQGPPVQEGERR